MLDKQIKWWQQQLANIQVKDRKAVTQKSRILLRKTQGTLNSHVFHKYQYSLQNIYKISRSGTEEAVVAARNH